MNNNQLIENLFSTLGGLFGQKPNTGFGASFGAAPVSSAATGFGGLGTFTPASGK